MQKILNYLFNDPRFLGFDSFGRVSVEFRFAPWITLFLAIAAVLLAIYAYRQATNLSSTKRRILTTLRASAYIALLFILAGPELRFEGEGGQSGPIPVVLDRTESMTIEDMTGKSRFFCASALRNSLIENNGEEKTLKQIQYLYGNGAVALPESIPEKRCCQ